MADQNFTTPPEIFKPIPGYPGYEVSDFGRVRSFWRSNGSAPGTKDGIPGGRFIAPTPQRILIGGVNRGGYHRVTLRRGGKNHSLTTSRLVLTTFVGPCPEGMEVCHNDGTRSNDSLANLRWDTKSANSVDSIQHGTHVGLRQQGMHGPGAKLTDEQVGEIRGLYVHGHLQKDIAELFGVTLSNIWCIVHRKTWRHIA